ncbi:MAG: signal peptidase I [Bacilli bacterium]|nr:signal peptidase I [Bacilli bacterium]
MENNQENQEFNPIEEPLDVENEISEEELLKQQEKAKKLKKNYLKLFIELVLSSLVYLIASSCDKFANISASTEGIKNIIILNYAKYVMYVTYVLTIIAIIIFIIKLTKKALPQIKVNLEKLYNVLDWLILLPVCIAIATFCFSFVFTLTTVSGSSMNPNIYEGDKLLVTYPRKYERFDVVVVHVDETYNKVASDDLYLKRIIGLPGDYLDYKLENGYTQLYINGEKVNEYFYTLDELKKYLTYNTSSIHEPFTWAEKCFTDGGTSPKDSCEYVDGHFIIPEGYYFVLGDNRLGSKDSRDIGLIKEEDLIGRTRYIVNNIFKPEKID